MGERIGRHCDLEEPIHDKTEPTCNQRKIKAGVKTARPANIPTRKLPTANTAQAPPRSAQIPNEPKHFYSNPEASSMYSTAKRPPEIHFYPLGSQTILEPSTVSARFEIPAPPALNPPLWWLIHIRNSRTYIAFPCGLNTARQPQRSSMRNTFGYTKSRLGYYSDYLTVFPSNILTRPKTKS